MARNSTPCVVVLAGDRAFKAKACGDDFYPHGGTAALRIRIGVE